MSDDLHRMLGEANGKLDLLIDSFREYREAHDRRHESIDTAIKAHEADINQAKGAKAAVFVVAAVVSSFVGVAIAAVERFLK